MKTYLNNVTFNIPVRIDSKERLENINYIVSYLLHNFYTNIIVYENGPEQLYTPPKGVYHFYEYNTGPFHRTRYLNKLATLSETKIIANYDCDVIFAPKQLIKSNDLLMSGELDIVYPYDGYFVNLNRGMLDSVELKNYDVTSLNPDLHHNFGKGSMGGAVLWNKQKFIDIGMENENFISWGCEDWERVRRATKLGLNIGRITGPLYHLDHPRKQDSNESNPHYQQNVVEFQKIDAMDPEQLKGYIKTWHWL